jgi:hypothetical protein
LPGKNENLVVKVSVSRKMKSLIKSTFQKLYQNQLGQAIRVGLGFRVPAFLRPTSRNAMVSDQMPWREDDTWETRYDLMNIPSLLEPEAAPTDTVTIVLFDHQGTEISRHKVSLEPFETRQFFLKDFLNGFTGSGTFCCFHFSSSRSGPSDQDSFTVDRQYVAFRRKNDVLWNYVHGNLYARTKNPEGQKINSLMAKDRSLHCYRPHLRFADCDKFEAVYTNPAQKSVPITVKLLDENRNEISRKKVSIPPGGLHVFEFENLNRQCVMIEHQGGLAFWRPVIFKYYETHFDVLHS